MRLRWAPGSVPPDGIRLAPSTTGPCGRVEPAQGRRGWTAIDTIKLTGLSATGFHGVYPEERRQGQTFIVDVEMGLDLPTGSDDLGETVNYAEVARMVEEVVTGEPCNLIETVAGRIVQQVLSHTRVQVVTVTVHKPHAPVAQSVTDLSVTITRSR